MSAVFTPRSMPCAVLNSPHGNRGNNKARKKILPSGCDIFIVRLPFSDSPANSRYPEYGNSRPCRGCVLWLASYGIKRAYYTTGIVSDPVKCEQVRDLVANLNSVYITWSVKATSHSTNGQKEELEERDDFLCINS